MMLRVLNLRNFCVARSFRGGAMKFSRTPVCSTHSSSTDLQKYLKKQKLGRFQCFEQMNYTSPCVEILRNNHEDLDLVHVRSRQPQVLYLRTELVLQRINFLQPIGITARQKRKLIERSPPALVFDYDPERVEGIKISYLRGVVRGRDRTNTEEKISHILHPCSSLIVMRAFDLRNKVEFIQEQLGMAQQSVLRLILNIPSFLLHCRPQMSEDFHYIHKHMLPQGFDLDRHTAELYPPVYQPSDDTHPLIHSKLATENMARSLPLLSMSDVLDYSFKEHNYGKGKPEDLVEFLTRAEARELRPRYNKVV